MTTQDIIRALNETFELKAEVLRGNQIRVSMHKKQVAPVLLYLKNQWGFIHLDHVSCVDWIEENVFELIYIVYHPQHRLTVLVKTKIHREHPEMENMEGFWPHMCTYQREIREMFGIEFPGFEAPREFILEGWEEIPPMRRDFDTRGYVKRTYTTRPGREDAWSVREYITRRTGEKLPDFAKKYSRD